MKSHRLKLVVLVIVIISAVDSAYPDYGGEIVETPVIDQSYQVQLQSEPVSQMDYDFSVEGGDNATDETAAMTTMIPEYIIKNRTENEPIPNILFDDSEDTEDQSPPQTAQSVLPQPKGRSFEIQESDEVDGFMGAMPVATTSQPLYHPQNLPAVDAVPASFFPQQQQSTTTLPPVVAPTSSTTRSKQGKKIHIKKLLPHEQLRNYIEDAYIRMPLAVIVDPSPAALDKTKNLFGDTLRSNIAIKIVLVSLNSSGMPTAYNFNNTRQFLAGLNSIRDSPAGNPFVGIIQACELIPYDSAVFISTAHIPIDADFGQEAAITLLKKRIRLYLIWYGEKSLSENETQGSSGGILGELAIKSGGDILHIVGNENSLELDENTLTLVADSFRGTEEIELPVDTTVSSLHIKIDSVMRSATLETPNGEINLRKLVTFKSPREIAQNLDTVVPIFNLQNPTTFRLKLTPEYPESDYKVYIKADKKKKGNPVKRYNRITHDSLKFPEEDVDKKTKVSNDVETFPPVNVNTTSSRQLDSDIISQKSLRVRITKETKLLVGPGETSTLYYEVDNIGNTPVNVDIEVTGEHKFLQALNPPRFTLAPKSTQKVAVRIAVPPNTPQGTHDRIKFSAQIRATREITSITALAKVLTQEDAADRKEPYLSWTFGSRCDTGYNRPASCSERYWNLEITAQDWGSGLLGLYSQPINGLIVSDNFVAGSNEPLRATFVANCCQPKVTLSVYDLNGNQRSNAIDVNDLVLSEGSIAAIVLGCILLILLIILAIVGIVWCCKRRDKTVINYPTYTSSHRRASRTDDI